VALERKIHGMKHQNILQVVQQQLCHGCGVCESACMTGAISLELEADRGLYVPIINPERCTLCGKCMVVCPGWEVPIAELSERFLCQDVPDVGLGNVLSCNLSHAVDQKIRYDCTSGGVTTALLLHALETKIIDGVLTTRMNAESPFEPEVFIARTPSKEMVRRT